MGRAIGKNEEEVAVAMMQQIKDRCNPIEPPAISSDGNDSYPEAMLETWGKSPEYAGRSQATDCYQIGARQKFYYSQVITNYS